MATINYKVFKHHRKEDGTYNVKFVITKNRKRAYSPSSHHVTDKQLVKTTYKLKDTMVIDALNIEVANLRKKITELGGSEKNMPLDDLVSYLFKPDDTGDSRSIDFIQFCRDHIEYIKGQGRTGSVGGLRAALNNFIDFVGYANVSPGDITSSELARFEAYLRKDRLQRRDSGQGSVTLTRAKGLDSTGVYNMMNHFRVLFNACRKHYNTERKTIIANYPFDFYKMPKPQAKKKKKGGELTVGDIVRIARIKAPAGSRTELARDMWMLSFYLCGMNAKDIFDYDGPTDGDRLEYERSKTTGRRADRAFMSVRIPDEARPILEKWNHKLLHRRFKGYPQFIKAVCLGVDIIGNGNVKTVKSEKHRIEGLGIPSLTFYHARHTFATMAHKECGYSVEEIARALNHVDQRHKVTERYIDTDWSIVDRVQESVLQLFRKCTSE